MDGKFRRWSFYPRMLVLGMGRRCIISVANKINIKTITFDVICEKARTIATTTLVT